MSKIKLFEDQRIDQSKIEDGVWVEHPETGDSFRIRKHLCPQHLAAYLEAAQDYQDKNGKDAHSTPEGEVHCEAVGLASGLIVDWKLVNYPDEKYDAAFMASVLADPEKSEILTWFRISSSGRDRFRPEEAGEL